MRCHSVASAGLPSRSVHFSVVASEKVAGLLSVREIADFRDRGRHGPAGSPGSCSASVQSSSRSTSLGPRAPEPARGRSLDRDFGDAQPRSGLLDQARREPEAEARARRPPWSKKKGRRCRRIRSSGRPASSTIFAGRPLSSSWASAQAISASRLPSTNSRSRASVMRSSGLTRVPAAAISAPSACPDVPRDRNRGVPQPAAFLRGGRDAREGIGFLQLPPGIGAGFLFQPRQRARAFHFDQTRLDLRQQVGLRDRPGRAAHAEVLRGRGGRNARGRQGGQCGGEQQGGGAHHRGSSAAGPPRRFVQAGCGRIVARPASPILRPDQRPVQAEPRHVRHGDRRGRGCARAARGRSPHSGCRG